MAKRRIFDDDAADVTDDLDTTDDPGPVPEFPPVVEETPLEPEPEPVDPNTQIVVNGHPIPKPDGWYRDRTVSHAGKHAEHTHEDEHGRWHYRTM